MAASMRTFLACEAAVVKQLQTKVIFKPAVTFERLCSSETPVVSDEPEKLDRHAIRRLQDASRLPQWVKDHRKPLHKAKTGLHCRNQLWFQKKLFGMRGSKSGYNPSIAWPTKEELKDIKEYEAEFEPSLETMLNIAKEEREAWLKRKERREAIIDKNMAKMSTWMDEYRARTEKQKAEVKRLAEERQRRLEEVRKQLGVHLNPRDPRVKILLEEKEKAELKAQKQKKKQEKAAKLDSKIKSLSEQLD